MMLCFHKLGVRPVNNWDEARHGASAYEMLQTGEPIVTTWAYEPDYWNYKPPLSEYFIALGYKLLGYNAWGLRFYSACSILLTAIISTLFIWKNYGKIEAIFTLFAFSSCSQLFASHCGRNGDADALYILFYTAAVLFLCNLSKNFSSIYGACLCFALAFLTKSWHAGTIAILVLIVLAFSGSFFKMRFRDYLFCGFFSLFPVALWALLRIHKDGFYFIKQMFTNDVVLRSSEAIEGHTGSQRFYIDVLLRNDHGLVLLIIVLIIFGTVQWLRFNVSKKEDFFVSNQLIIFLSILIPFLIFTVAKSKLEWYIFCIYPCIILLAAISLHHFLKSCSSDFKVGVIIISFSVLFVCSWTNVKLIARAPSYSTDFIQELLSSKQNYERSDFYIVQDDGSDWTQALLLEAEWLSNCTPAYGGSEAFLHNEGSYLILPETQVCDYANFPIIQQSSGYVLLYNHSAK